MNVNWLVIPTLAAALLLFVAGQWSMRRCTSAGCRVAMVGVWFILGIPGFVLPLYYFHCFDKAKWFYEFRSLPFIQLTAAGAGLFAGALAELAGNSKRVSRGFVLAMLCLGILAPHLKPVVAPVPGSRFADRWHENVCLQSTQSSCGAASAATVFRALGVHRQERDIARECYTYLGGTENWYLARAFRRRGMSVRYRIEDGLPADLRPPAIAGVRLAGMGHFIAIVAREGDVYVTGDPLVGRREVPASRLAAKYDFTGFFMEMDRGKDGDPES